MGSGGENSPEDGGQVVYDLPARTTRSEVSAGTICRGEVVNVVDFGLFVSISSSIDDGLLHESDLKGRAGPEDYQPGQHVIVRVTGFDDEGPNIKEMEVDNPTVQEGRPADIDSSHDTSSSDTTTGGHYERSLAEKETTDDIAAKADNFADQFTDEGVTTSQLRRIYHQVKDIQQQFEETDESKDDDENNESDHLQRELVMLKPKLAYAAGRKDEMKDVREKVKPYLEEAIEGGEKERQHFFSFMEALVGYHKYYDDIKSGT